MHNFMQLTKFLSFVGEVPEHSYEIGEKFPCFVELSQQDGHEFVDIEDYLVEEVDEELSINIRQHFSERFSGHVAWIFGEEGVPECRAITRKAVLDDICQVVEDQFLVFAVLFLLNRDNST